MSLTAPAGNEWKTDIVGCLGDYRLSLLSCIIPCYVLGKNAEHLGEDFVKIALLGCVGFAFGPLIRWRLRQEKNLKGTIATDVLVYAIAPCCAMVQEAREIGWSDSSSAMARD